MSPISKNKVLLIGRKCNHTSRMKSIGIMKNKRNVTNSMKDLHKKKQTGKNNEYFIQTIASMYESIC